MILKKYKIEGVKVMVSLGYPKDRPMSKEERRGLDEFISLAESYPQDDEFVFDYLNINTMETLIDGDIKRVQKYLRSLKRK